MKKKKKNLFFPLIIIILFIFIFCFINFKRKYELKIFINKINNYINVEEFYIYGTHLNIKINNKLEKPILILKSSSNEIKYELVLDNDNYILSSKLNEGIDLEKLDNDKYYIIIKDNDKYYNLVNNTNYNNLTYYSISDKKIDLNFNENMILNIEDYKTPSDIYDIVIDAGHGGIDSGATSFGYNESTLTLEYSKSIKKYLEKLGYKVKLTREDDIYLKSYGKNSRTSIPYEVKAKYLFSIHFNSSESYISNNGFEIYIPNNINYDLANSLVNKIKSIGINTSTNTSFKINDGIYLRNLSKTDINNMQNEAIKNGYEMYNVDTSTPYLYMIRETGGFMTKAYMDGRNTKYDKNNYYNSNIGSESYLLELGYINNKNDINFIINNKDNYSKVIAYGIDEYIKNT